MVSESSGFFERAFDVGLGDFNGGWISRDDAEDAERTQRIPERPERIIERRAHRPEPLKVVHLLERCLSGHKISLEQFLDRLLAMVADDLSGDWVMLRQNYRGIEVPRGEVQPLLHFRMFIHRW